MLDVLLQDCTSLIVEWRTTGTQRSFKDLDREELVGETGWRLETREWFLHGRNEVDELFLQTGISANKKFADLTDEEQCKFAMYLKHIGWAPPHEDDAAALEDDNESYHTAASSRSDGVGSKGDASEVSEVIEKWSYQERICVACQESEAVFVGARCGHLAYCLKCRRGAVYRQLKESSAARGLPEKRQLQSRHLERTAVPCPICRKEGRLVRQEQFDGQVFIS